MRRRQFVIYKRLVSESAATYNRADIVGQASESILGQTYGDIEALLVDDGSTDGTHEGLRRFGNLIRVVRRKMLDLELPDLSGYPCFCRLLRPRRFTAPCC
jgi:cellulose synthase/poly-beta-1,6-N-acetylglucosamine synthase-like glycosyltransferase